MKTNIREHVKAWSRRALMAVVVSGAMLGCTKKEIEYNNDKEKGETFTFTAVAPTGSMTRAVWDAEPNETTGKLGFNWEDTDNTISIYWQGDAELTTVDMSLTPDDPSAVTVTTTRQEEKYLYVVFPADSSRLFTIYENYKMPYPKNLPSTLTQKGASTDHLRGNMYLYGSLTADELTADNPTMQLSHLCAVLRFKVKNGTSDAVRVTKVEMLATDGNEGVVIGVTEDGLKNLFSDITVNVQDANDETKGHNLATGDTLSVYAHCIGTNTALTDGQFQFRVTVTDADGNNQRVFLTREAFSTEGISTCYSLDNTKKIFAPGYYYTFNLDIGSVGDGGRFAEVSTWISSTEASESVSGEGTEASPYLIASAEDLQWMINHVNEENASSGKYYKLATYIHIDSDEDNPWTPIGTIKDGSHREFKGTFDGDNYAIYGTMVAGNENDTRHFVGFFGYACNCTIKNLHIKADMTCKYVVSSDDEAYYHVGGVVGFLVHGTIENCTNSGNVTGCDIDNISGAFIGGIVGFTISLGDYYNIKNCVNYGSVTSTYAATSDYGMGGIVGYIGSEMNSGEKLILITGCINYGTVTPPSNYYNSGYRHYVGGLVGWNTGVVCTCCKDESDYKDGDGALRPIGEGYDQEQVAGCTGTH